MEFVDGVNLAQQMADNCIDESRWSMFLLTSMNARSAALGRAPSSGVTGAGAPIGGRLRCALRRNFGLPDPAM